MVHHIYNPPDIYDINRIVPSYQMKLPTVHQMDQTLKLMTVAQVV